VRPTLQGREQQTLQGSHLNLLISRLQPSQQPHKPHKQRYQRHMGTPTRGTWSTTGRH
jgi:hypothetical protein